MFAAVQASPVVTIGTLLPLVTALVLAIVSMLRVRQRRDLTEAEAEDIREKINLRLLRGVSEQLEVRDDEIARLTRENVKLRRRVSELELRFDNPPPELA